MTWIDTARYTVQNTPSTRVIGPPRALWRLNAYRGLTVGRQPMLAGVSAQATALDREAGRLFYAIAGVEDVRREDDSLGTVFWVRGSHLSDVAIEQIVEAKFQLARRFPGRSVGLHVSDRFGRLAPHTELEEALTSVYPPYLAAGTSARGGR